MKRITKYFLKGLLIFVPAVLTVVAIVWVFTTLDTLFRNFLNITMPGLGLVLTIVIITVIGFLASNFVGKKLFALLDAIFKKLPLVKLLYSAKLAREKGWSYIVVLPLVFATLHFSYGIGFLVGLVRFFGRWFRDELPPPCLAGQNDNVVHQEGA